MGDPKGFLKAKRKIAGYRPVCERIRDYKEVSPLRSTQESYVQTARCMDCGTPFCHWACPVSNHIPEWNDLVFNGQWRKAYELLQSTNNFPEITGRVCPAPCEYSCVLGINDEPVTCRENELAIIEYAFKKGWVKPKRPAKRTGKKVAVIGSGPAGLAAADQLNKAGHSVTVFEKDDRIGGIVRYGIPDFKHEKKVLDRRIRILKKEGIRFITSVNVGIDFPVAELKRRFDAVCLAGGSRKPRDLSIPGRDLDGIHFAMDYLVLSNKRITGNFIPKGKFIDAKGKKVVVIGGGDTGSDCIGTANRQGADCVTQIEVMPMPANCRTEDYPWPQYPLLLKSSSSHEEGADRHWSILTKRFVGHKGRVTKLSCVRVEFVKDKNACPLIREIPGSEFEIEADLVILAIGFIHPEHSGLLSKLGVAFDERGNVRTDDDHMTSVKGIFSAGDMRRGQSLIVWAIAEGRRSAAHIHAYLKKKKGRVPKGQV